MNMTRSCIATAGVLISLCANAAAQDFVVGASGAITGPTASTYAPTIEALRIYFDRVNRMGGIMPAT